MDWLVYVIIGIISVVIIVTIIFDSRTRHTKRIIQGEHPLNNFKDRVKVRDRGIFIPLVINDDRFVRFGIKPMDIYHIYPVWTHDHVWAGELVILDYIDMEHSDSVDLWYVSDIKENNIIEIRRPDSKERMEPQYDVVREIKLQDIKYIVCP